MFRLDYLSCCLTVLSTVLVGRSLWQGWFVAGVNSLILCVIAFQTRQTGLVPANLFCIALYGVNLWRWRSRSSPR
jgi:nicotinamide riboside transporter PnuC